MICNVDACFFTSYNRTGYGACTAVGGWGEGYGWLCPELQIHEEGIAMLKVMKWVPQMGLSRMTFLSDSQVLVAAIFTRTEGQSEFNIIV